MTNRSLAHPAHQSIEQIVEAVERELARVKAARPGLASRIARAEGILVTHLSCKRQRVIRVRVSGGRPRFLVSGSGGAVYVVNPSDWSCTCPDHHRRGAGCKHALACWALWRASVRPAREDLEHVEEIVGRVPLLYSCASCGEGFSRRDLFEVGPEQAEWALTASEGDLLCRPCGRAHGAL